MSVINFASGWESRHIERSPPQSMARCQNKHTIKNKLPTNTKVVTNRPKTLDHLSLPPPHATCKIPIETKPKH